MGSYTPNLGLYKPDIGETDWGDKVNANFDVLDEEVNQNSLDIADILNNKLPPLQTDVAYNKTQISKIKKEMLTIALNVMMNKALLNAETKDFYSIIADVTTPDYPNGFKSTLILPTAGVTFDNDGGGQWTEAIKIPLTTIPSEHAQYRIVIQSSTMQIYSADGTLKAEYGAQTGVASDFWDDVKSDGSDIRVADQNYQQLYFYVEEFDYANSYADIRVRIETGTTELYIAYGNPLATKSSYEDPTQVFEFFDDFNDADISDYSVITGSFTAEQRDTNDYYIKGTDVSVSLAVHSVITKVSADVIFEFEAVSHDSSKGGVGIVFNYFSSDTFLHARMYDLDNELQIYEFSGGSATKLSSVLHTIETNTWYKLRTIWKSDKTIVLQLLDDQGNVLAETQATHTLDIAEKPIGVRTYGQGGVDNIKILKLADPADFGTAETITLVTTGDFLTVTFDFPEGVDKLLITVDTDATAIYYSTDDGATWTQITPDTESGNSNLQAM